MITRSNLSVTSLALLALTLIGATSTCAQSIADKEQAVADFMVRDTAPVLSCMANVPSAGDMFLSSLPTGLTKRGSQRTDLQDTCELQDNVLYAIKALQPFTSGSPSGADVSNALVKFYQKYYPRTYHGMKISEQTLNYCAIGVLTPVIAHVPTGRYYHMTQTLDTDHKPYFIETKYHETDGSGRYLSESLGDSCRNMMKYGCLLEVIRGHTSLAKTYFKQALALWDGHGFIEYHSERKQEKKAKSAGKSGDEDESPDQDVSPTAKGAHPDPTYHTRNLCFALICDQALGAESPLSPAQKATIKEILWDTCWDSTRHGGTGGIWTDYTWSSGKGYGIPKVAKLTNEIAPLALLTDEKFLWPGFSYTP